MLLIMIPDQYPNYYKVLEIYTGCFDSVDISAENRFQNKDRLIGQFNEQSSINNRLLSLCVPPGHSSMKAIDARD